VSKVGVTYQNAGSQVLRIPVKSSNDANTATNLLTIDFPKDLDLQVLKQVNIISILGSNWTQAQQKSPRELLVWLPGLISESHTVVEITLPQDYFSLSPDIQFISTLRTLPDITWWVISAIMAGLTILYVTYLSRSQSLKPGPEQTFPPDSLSPFEAGILLHNSVQPVHVTALIFDLANRNHLQILHTREGILILRQNGSDPRGLTSYEQLFLDLLTPLPSQPNDIALVSEGMDQSIFSDLVSSLYVEAFDRLSSRGYFATNPRLIHLKYKTAGIIIQLSCLAGALLTFLYLMHIIPGLLVPIMTGYVCGFIIYHAGYRISPLNAHGKEVRKSMLGFLVFLSDPRSINIHQEISNPSSLYFLYFPYALITGHAQEWSHRFNELTIAIPTWYTTTLDYYLTPDEFTDQVTALTERLAAVFVKVKDPNVD
jgi:hypothetical protein